MYALVDRKDAKQDASLPPPPSSSSPPSTAKRVLLVLLLVTVGLTTSLVLVRFMRSDAFHHVVLWLQTHETLGAVLYVCCFTSFIVLCFPSTAFELLAGYIFGFSLGLILATRANSWARCSRSSLAATSAAARSTSTCRRATPHSVDFKVYCGNARSSWSF